MCVHPNSKGRDQLGQTLHKLDFIDQTQDTCDYIDLTDNDPWYSNKNDLLSLQLNIRGLINKQEDLLGLINTIAGKQKIDVITLQETWITQSDIFQVNFPGYKHYGIHRVGHKGGGVSVLISKELTSHIKENLCLNKAHIECCVVEVQLPNESLYVGSVYRPPNMDINKFCSDFSALTNKLKKAKADLIIGTDHNLDFLKSDKHSQTQNYLGQILESELIPCITRPTRITKSSATLIDNILISRQIYGNCKCGIILSDLSDHFPCIMSWPDVIRNKKDFITININRIDEKNYNSINTDLEIDWDSYLCNATANESFQLFHNKLLETLDQYVENKTVKLSYKKVIKEPWLTKGIIQANRKQLLLYKNWLKDKDNIKYERYKQYQKVLRKIKRNCKMNYYQDQCEKYKRDSKKLWQTINNICGRNRDTSCCISHLAIDGTNHYDADSISNKFANHFATIGKKYSESTPVSTKSIDLYLSKIKANNKSIFLTPCTVNEIKKIISALASKKSSGYDGISNVMIKKLSPSISMPLTIIFNKSLVEGIFPDLMKTADVIPLHKGGNPHLLDNYRPISLLLTLSKILEKIVYVRMYDFLDHTNQFYNSQYSFRSKHSCEHAITELVGNALKGKENKEHTIAIFLDLSKAFDTLEHTTLLKKRDLYGIRGICHKWFESYLSNRVIRSKCTTSTETAHSDEINISFGVPQGSCLGPLLFLIFVNDLHLNLEYSKCILFADNTTIYMSHQNLNYLMWALEHDLNILHDWFNANKLTLNKKKSVCIFFQGNNNVNRPDFLSIENNKLHFVEYTKFLGVWIDDKLNWNTHLSKLINTLHRNSHLLFRSKRYLNCPAKKTLYYAQIYSHISYGIGIWGPMINCGWIRKLRNIQVKCLHCIKKNLDTDCLSIRNIINLEKCKFG